MILLLVAVALLGHCSGINFQHQLLQLDDAGLERQLDALKDYLERFQGAHTMGKVAVMRRVIDSFRANRTRDEPLVYLQRLVNNHAFQMRQLRRRFLAEPIDAESQMSANVVDMVLYDVAEDEALQRLVTPAEKSHMQWRLKRLHALEAWTQKKRDRLSLITGQIAQWERAREDVSHFEKYPETVDRALVERVIARLADLVAGDEFQAAVSAFSEAKTPADRRATQKEVHRLWMLQ